MNMKPFNGAISTIAIIIPAYLRPQKKNSQNSEIQVVGFMTRVRKETYHVREPLSETLSNPNDNFMSTHVLLAPGHGRSNKKG